MGCAASTPPQSPQLYRPRAAEHTVLYGIVRAHLATFLYHGILVPHARGRASAVVPAVADDGPAGVPERPMAPADDAPPPRRYFAWAELLRRIFALDVLACAGCGGRLRFIATIEDPVVVARILRHVGLPTEVPEPAPARSPPTPAGPLAFEFSA